MTLVTSGDAQLDLVVAVAVTKQDGGSSIKAYSL